MRQRSLGGALSWIFLVACAESPQRFAAVSVAEAGAAAPCLASFVALNPAGYARRDIITLTLPFADAAEYRGEPLAIGDQPIDCRQLGAAWPDGSWRTGTAHVPVRLGPLERRTFDVRRARGALAPPFAFGSGVGAGAGGLTLAVRIGTAVAPVAAWELVEATPLVRCWQARVRVPGTMAWAEAHLEVGSGLDHARWWLQVGDSDPRDPDLSHQLGAVALLVTGPTVVVHHERAACWAVARTGAATTATLDPGSRWADGESLAVHARLLFAAGAADRETLAAESVAPVLAVASTWPQSGAWGPWGYVPARDDLDVAMAGKRAMDAQGTVPTAWGAWDAPAYGCAQRPAGTGDQPDFSCQVMLQEAAGYPDRLHAIAWSVYREACRPTHLREVNGLPTALAADRLWDCRPDSRISHSMYGKSATLAPGQGHGQWWGHDQQHYSIHYLTAYALLTSDRWALEECAHQADLWLGLVKDGRSGAVGLDNLADHARSEGRPLHSGAELYLVTGREDVRDRLRARLDNVVAQQWTGRDTDPVRPIRGNLPPDMRYTDLPVPVWIPWQEACAVVGMDAAIRISRYAGPATADIPWHVGRTVATWGIWQDQGATSWHAGKAVEWRAGGAVGEQREAYDPYLPWISPGLVIAKREALARGDTATVQRCELVLEQIRAAARTDWRVHEWAAVR